MDGKKLPLLLIFKGKLEGSVDKRLPQLLPTGAFYCVEPNGWMDNRTMRI